jgi:hypothetical protein
LLGGYVGRRADRNFATFDSCDQLGRAFVQNLARAGDAALADVQ